MPIESPTVSVIVPCRNEQRHIEGCIQSILAQVPPPGGFEVLVADGQSDDGTLEILRGMSAVDSRLRVIENPLRIVSTALNRGIREARGSIIVRMDAHTEYAPDYIRECVRVLGETGADNVGGPWIAKGRGAVSSAIAAAFQSPFGVGGARGHDAHYEGIVDTVYLGCWRRKVFEEVGYFDESLVRNQDDEFNLRLTRAGKRVWQSPKIRSLYTPRGSISALFRQYSQYGYWKVLVIRKHNLPASFRHLVPGAFVFSLLFLPPFAFWWSALTWVWLAIAGAYVAANVGASVITAIRANVAIFPLLPLVFACYHVGYGWGFLRGVSDFLILRRQPATGFTRLTRTVVSSQEAIRRNRSGLRS